jgi:predicted transposase YdaD
MEIVTSWMEQGIERGIEQGIERGERSLILRQLSRRVGELPDALRSQINTLSVPQLESLGEALLDFSSLADLEAWLRTN